MSRYSRPNRWTFSNNDDRPYGMSSSASYRVQLPNGMMTDVTGSAGSLRCRDPNGGYMSCGVSQQQLQQLVEQQHGVQLQGQNYQAPMQDYQPSSEFELTLPNGQQVTVQRRGQTIRCRNPNGGYMSCPYSQQQLMQMIQEQHNL